jgi:TPR repeat protein
MAVAGCASHFGAAQSALERGDYQTAHDNYLACAQRGTAVCMNNLGVMFARGQIRDPDPRQKAIFWYELAARHGDSTARANLTQMGLPVPPADLVRQKSAAQIEAELEAADAVGALIGELIGGSIGRRR